MPLASSGGFLWPKSTCETPQWRRAPRSTAAWRGRTRKSRNTKQKTGWIKHCCQGTGGISYTDWPLANAGEPAEMVWGQEEKMWEKEDSRVWGFYECRRWEISICPCYLSAFKEIVTFMCIHLPNIFRCSLSLSRFFEKKDLCIQKKINWLIAILKICWVKKSQNCFWGTGLNLWGH